MRFYCNNNSPAAASGGAPGTRFAQRAGRARIHAARGDTRDDLKRGDLKRGDLR